jgi:hypothetical protein
MGQVKLCVSFIVIPLEVLHFRKLRKVLHWLLIKITKGEYLYDTTSKNVSLYVDMC